MTDFLEYLRFSVAEEIKYNHKQGSGEFVIKARKTKIMGASITQEDAVDHIPVT